MNSDDKDTELYMLDDNGKLHRAGVHIGTLEADAIALKPEHKNFKASVTRWLREKADQTEAQQAGGVEEKPKPKKKGNDADGEELAAMTKEARAEAEKSRARHQDDLAFSAEHKCPPPPKKNPQYGDKTPGYVDWLHRYRRDIWELRFGVKGKGNVPVIRQNAEGIEEVVGYREADMATRKTHLTEKLETNRGLAEDMDWDA